MSKQSRLNIIRDHGNLDIKYLDSPIILDAAHLTDDIDTIPLEAFKNNLQNRLELVQMRINLWFKEIIQEIGDYTE
jgi:hypothetical protein